MNPHLDSSSALSLLKESDLETFVFELLDFLYIFFGRERKGGGKEEGCTCWELNFHFKGLGKDNFFSFFSLGDHCWL